MGVTKVKHPNKGHTPNKGQKPMYQGVRYSESPLYIIITSVMQGLFGASLSWASESLYQ